MTAAARRWALVLGRKGRGASALAGRIAAALRARGLAVTGVLQEGIECDGVHVEIRLRRLASDERAPLARRGGAARGEHERESCSFVFDDRAFATARSWIAADLERADVVLVDAVSSLEAVGGGHHDAVSDALARAPLVVLVVRAEELFSVMERFGLDEPVAVLDVGESAEIEPFVSAVTAAAR